MKTFFKNFAFVMGALLWAITPVYAQSPACNQFRAELSALDAQGRGGRAEQFAQAAQRQNSELQRTVNYARQLGCDRGGLFNTLPQECSSVNAQIARMRSNLSQLEERAEGGGNSARRQQLLASIDRACRVAPVEAKPQQQRGLFESIFGGAANPPPPQEVPVAQPRRQEPTNPLNTMPDLDGRVVDVDADEEESSGGRRYGGSRAVCVRTCDGFFFPVNVLPDGRSGANEMCQSLCPATETKAYFMSGSGEIKDAVSQGGEGYGSLANAGKFQTSFDAACGCRKTGQSWAQALKEAEEMLDARKGDIFVTEAKADELQRSATKGTLDDKSKAKISKNKNKQPVPEATATVSPADLGAQPSINADAASLAEAALGASAPTATQESSGIGPQTIVAQSVTSTGIGKTVDVALPNGEKRKVRIIGTGQQPTN